MMFTIIFPVLNERLRLESGVTRTVEYLRKIGFEDYEIIIVDNGSEDETPQIAEMLCKKYDKVRYERIRRRGVGAAFRRGVELSRGDVVVDNPAYCTIGSMVADSGASGNGMTSAAVPFLVKVSITDLNIRKGPGTNYSKTGKYTGKGVFTITEVKSGTGSTLGWGKLKSGAGWIALDHCTKL